jgi:hypothetical protein
LVVDVEEAHLDFVVEQKEREPHAARSEEICKNYFFDVREIGAGYFSKVSNQAADRSAVDGVTDNFGMARGRSGNAAAIAADDVHALADHYCGEEPLAPLLLLAGPRTLGDRAASVSAEVVVLRPVAPFWMKITDDGNRTANSGYDHQRAHNFLAEKEVA